MADIVKGFGRFSVRKPLMEEPAWALGRTMGICVLAWSEGGRT